MIQIKHNKLRIPTGGRLTSWLFTKCGGVEFRATEDKSIQWKGGGSEPGTSELQVQHPTTRPRSPHHFTNITNIYSIYANITNIYSIYANITNIYKFTNIYRELFLLSTGNTEMVSVMLEANCDVTVKMGIPATVTPISLAEDLGLEEIVELLSKSSVS